MKNEKGENLSQSCDFCHETVADRLPFSEWRSRLYPAPGKDGKAGDGGPAP